MRDALSTIAAVLLTPWALAAAVWLLLVLLLVLAPLPAWLAALLWLLVSLPLWLLAVELLWGQA